MTRGRLDLGNHKLAGLYRAPPQRAKWKRARREKCPDEQYRQLWALVSGAVRDTFACHPEYLTEAGRMAAERSITKRVTGTLHGYAAQVARGRSAQGVPDAAADMAGPYVTGASWSAWLSHKAMRVVRTIGAHLGMVSPVPEIHRSTHD